MSSSSVDMAFGSAAADKRNRRRKRPAPLSVRLSDAEKARLKREAEGGSVHALVRARILGPRRGGSAALQKIDRAALAQALAKLGQSRLSSNMNQIARAANAGQLPLSDGLIRELHRACADIRAMRIGLTQALGLKLKN